MIFSLDDVLRFITIEPLTAMDLLSSLCAMLIVLWVIGYPFRKLNALHFHAFGRFEPAELPPIFLRSLLKTKPPIDTPGLTTFNRLHKIRKTEVPVDDPKYVQKRGGASKKDRITEVVMDLHAQRQKLELAAKDRKIELRYTD